MILNLKENRSARYALVATIVFTVFLTWLYLAGGIFLGIIGLDYNKATPLTAIQYAWYFSDNAWIATRLAGSLGLSAVFLGIPAALLFRKQTPSLHGDARFATSAKITEKQVQIALTYIYGIGPKHVSSILAAAKIEPTT